jgi:hypothetical protein
MKKTSLITGLFSLFTLATAGAATISPTDPSPNAYAPVTFEPLDGGVGYAWTVSMSGKDNASLEGLVGAWSWDEDSFPETAKGWTHTSNWVALKLNKASKVTIRLFRKLNVSDGQGGVGGNILFPAFTVYQNWDGDGGDSHTYNNRGNVEWAEDLTYLTHVENDGTATSVDITLELSAGMYSLAVGGNSSSTNREPFQGYGLEITTQPVDAPSLEIKGGSRFMTSELSHGLSGSVANADKAKSLQVVRGGRSKTVKMKGDSWSADIDKLEPGRNVVWLKLEDTDGKIADRKRVVIHRQARVVLPLSISGS